MSLDRFVDSNHFANFGTTIAISGPGRVWNVIRGSTTQGQVMLGLGFLNRALETVRETRMSLQLADLEVVESDLEKARLEGWELWDTVKDPEGLTLGRWPWARFTKTIKFRREAQALMGIAMFTSMQAKYQMHRGRLHENEIVQLGVNETLKAQAAQTRPADTKQADDVSPCDPGIPIHDTSAISTPTCDDQTTPTSDNSYQGPLPCGSANTQNLDDRLTHLMVTLNDKTLLRAVFCRRDTEAQMLLNDVQELLGHPLESQVRSILVGVLIKLSRRSGLYPECLVRTDIHRTGEDAVAGGQFGDVWKGHMDGREVAVKVLRIYAKSDLEKLLKKFSREAVTWHQLSHPNILPFCGIYHLNNERTRVCLVSPWMSNGNVREFLTQFPDTDRVNLIFDVASGLEYLHKMKPCIVHGDLKGVNVLITSDRRACLADFGLAIVKDSSFTTFSMSSERSHGTLRWMAPELLVPALDDDDGRGGKCPATDVYAFACVCYEIFTGNFPFHDIRMESSVIEAVSKGKRPPRPPQELCQTRGLNEKIWSIVEECWTMSPTKRPTASQIVEYLRSPNEEFLPQGDGDGKSHDMATGGV